jgi:hypothetical protein
VNIKSREEPDVRAARRLIRGAAARWWLILGLYTLFLCGIGVVAYATGALQRAAEFVSTTTAQRAYRKMSGLLTAPERILIDIPHTNLMNLSHQRDVALARQVLVVTDADIVTASVRHAGQAVPVRIRLKGDLVDHLEGDKWSFRIMVRGDATILGMKDFSIQHPATRDYLNEKLYHEAMRREGLIALRYEFIDVTLNGKGLGVYALEETFEARLIEYNQRKDGPVIRFNEDVLWGELARQESVPPRQRGAVAGAGGYFSSDVDAFETTRWTTDPALRPQYLAAIQLLDAFRRGEVTVAQAFDVKQLATFFALSDLLSAWHGVANWPNARFYYNPVTSKLEPVAFDAYDRQMPGRPTLLALMAQDERRALAGRRYISQFFADPEFYKLYVAELERVSDPKYVQALVDAVGPMLDRGRRILNRDYPEYEFTWTPIHRAAEFIQIALHPPKAVHAYLRTSSPGTLVLDVANMGALPLRVLGLARESSTYPATPVDLPGKNEAEPLAFQSLRFPVPLNVSWPDEQTAPMKIRVQVPGSATVDEADVFPYPYDGLGPDALRDAIVRQPSNAHTFPFITIDEQARRMGVRPGAWRVDRHLVIPPGYRVFAGPATRLDLVKGAAIVSWSPLDFRGDANAPIVIESSDRSGQGVAVLQAREPSVVERVDFIGLSNTKQHGWELSGAVTFYESPVEIRRSRFLANRSEDALHIMRARLLLDTVTFEETAADAIDVDFGTGNIRHARFAKIGKDAVDASGSTMLIEDMEVHGAGDAGVSSGEGSALEARDIRFRDVSIGLASKDRSTLRVSKVRMTGGQVGVTAYQRKSEFGPASVELSGLDMHGQKMPFLVERESSVRVDGRRMPADRNRVVETLYGVDYGKTAGR